MFRRWYRAECSRYCAAFITENNLVVDAAPIIRNWIKGMSYEEAKVILKNWNLDVKIEEMSLKND